MNNFSPFPDRFSGRVAVITGAAQGVGLACARRIGAEGATVIIADLAREAVQEAAEQLRAEGIDGHAFAGDLAKPEICGELMQHAVDQHGKLDILVNNVGGTIWKKPFWHYENEEIVAEVERSFWPMLWTAHAVIRTFRQQRWGVLVNIGSNAVDGHYRVPYSACKGAVAALTTSLAVETASLGIRVNCVALGGTTAPERKNPRLSRELTTEEKEWERQFLSVIEGEDLLGRFATLEEQAAVVAFLASHEASHITGEIIQTGRRGRRLSDYLESIP